MPSKVSLRRLSLLAILLVLALCTLARIHGSRFLRADVADTGAPPSADSGSSLIICGASPTLFPLKKALQWDDLFRSNVEEIIDADATVNVSCTENARAEASNALQKLADQLPMWKDKSLDESDMPQVLLDYLEAYGCAERARADNLVDEVKTDTTVNTTYGQIGNEVKNRKDNAQSQLDATRETMKRVLQLLIGRSKLQPLDRSFTCLNRASKDIRNIFGLLAEESACIPVRTWDAKTPLRDLSQSSLW